MPQITSTKSSIETTFDKGHLRAVYENLKTAKYDHLNHVVRLPKGWDNVTLEQFEKQLDQHLGAIQRRVLSCRYTFRPFLHRDIPKTGGDVRTIAFSGIRDRIVQAALHEVIAPAVDDQLTDAACAYRSGRSAHDAVVAVHRTASNGRHWFCESDFGKFFDTLDHDRLLDLISLLDIDERAKLLTWRFVRTGYLPHSATERSVPAARTIGVPQGGVISGVLANLYLAEFDSALESADVTLVRYADDFVVLTESRDACHDVWPFVEEATRALRLTLHPDKTHVGRHINSGLEFVGFRIKGSLVSVKPDNIARFKNRITTVCAAVTRRYLDNGYASSEAAVADLIRRVNLKITGVKVDGEPRSWMRFFRLINDERQIQLLDRWCWRRLSDTARRVGISGLKRSDLRARGMESLVAEYWNARKVLSTSQLAAAGFL